MGIRFTWFSNEQDRNIVERDYSYYLDFESNYDVASSLEDIINLLLKPLILSPIPVQCVEICSRLSLMLFKLKDGCYEGDTILYYSAECKKHGKRIKMF